MLGLAASWMMLDSWRVVEFGGASRIAVLSYSDRTGSEWVPVATVLALRRDAYCRKHGYTCVHAYGRQLPAHLERAPHFEKVPAILATLSDPRFDAVLYLDDDTVLCNDELMVESFLGSYWQGVILSQHDHPKRLKGKRPWWTGTPNTGVAIYRSTQWVKRLLNDMLMNWRCQAFWRPYWKQHNRRSKWYHPGPKGECHDQCCFAVLTEDCQDLVGVVPMRLLQCSTLPRQRHVDRNRWAGQCVDPLVLHAMGGSTANKVKQLWKLVAVSDRIRGRNRTV